MINKIHNEDCFLTIQKMVDQNLQVDLVLTSPPYNTGRTTQTQKSIDNWENRYDIYIDQKTDQEYIDWSIELFRNYDKILKNNGVILYNMSYGSENSTNLLFKLIGQLIEHTGFMVGDCISWKKGSALPNNVSPNKLTRIIEFVFVFCRKDEYLTYHCNKGVKSQSKTGQKYYENKFNFVEAKNNDGVCALNKATFSSELCEKLLNMYARPNSLVYDGFMGTGTTAVACKKLGFGFIGSELSSKQIEYANERI